MNTSVKKVIWMILLGVLVLSTSLTLFQSLLGSSQQLVIAAIRRAMREQGFKTDLADFNLTTDAATRARTAALLTFANGPGLDAGGDELELLPAVSNDTASILWKEDSLKAGSHRLDWSVLHTALDPNHGLLDVACDAALSGPIRFDTAANKNIVAVGMQSSLVLNLSQMLDLRILLELREDHPDAAWTNLLAATRLVTACVTEPNGQSQCVQFEMTGTAFAEAWQVLQKGNWPDARLASLQQEWASADFFTNLVESTAIDYTNDIAICEKSFQSHVLTGSFLSDFIGNILFDPARGMANLKDGLALTRYGRHGLFTDETGLMLFFQRRALELRRALQAANWVQMRALPGVTNVVFYHSACRPVDEALQFDHTLDNDMLALAAGAEAQRRVVVTAIALERYRGRHGRYPAALCALAPEFLPAVPVDFMDGRPLRYRLTGDGHFVLYSIGLDGQDDGGMMTDPSSTKWIQNLARTPFWPMRVDIVWPRPANP